LYFEDLLKKEIVGSCWNRTRRSGWWSTGCK